MRSGDPVITRKGRLRRGTRSWKKQSKNLQILPGALRRGTRSWKKQSKPYRFPGLQLLFNLLLRACDAARISPNALRHCLDSHRSSDTGAGRRWLQRCTVGRPHARPTATTYPCILRAPCVLASARRDRPSNVVSCRTGHGLLCSDPTFAWHVGQQGRPATGEVVRGVRGRWEVWRRRHGRAAASEIHRDRVPRCTCTAACPPADCPTRPPMRTVALVLSRRRLAAYRWSVCRRVACASLDALFPRARSIPAWPSLPVLPRTSSPPPR